MRTAAGESTVRVETDVDLGMFLVSPDYVVPDVAYVRISRKIEKRVRKSLFGFFFFIFFFDRGSRGVHWKYIVMGNLGHLQVHGVNLGPIEYVMPTVQIVNSGLCGLLVSPLREWGMLDLYGHPDTTNLPS